MKHWARVVAGATAVALAVTLAGCSGDNASSGDDWRTNESLPVPVGAIHDLTGGLNVYGAPKSNVANLAVEDINANGGVLGRQLDLIEYDSKSANDQNVQYANELVSKDDVAVVVGGTTSAAREAMRPILDRAKTLYVYNTVYEGGLCDANVLVTGQTASQLIKPLVEYAAANIGKRIFIVGADYSFGRISGQWVKEYAKDVGAEVVGEEYIALDSSNFGATITHIQEQKPDVVISLVVGAGHVAFYREFAAKGLSATTTIVSPTFGNGNEQEILSPEESEGIIAAGGYYQELDNPLNQAFLESYSEAYGADHPYISDTAFLEWSGWHLWAAAVEKAGSFDRDKVVAALQSGDITADTPMGVVTVDGPTQHTVQPVRLVKVESGKFVEVQTFDAVPPAYEQSVCDLITNPTTNQQFTP